MDFYRQSHDVLATADSAEALEKDLAVGKQLVSDIYSFSTQLSAITFGDTLLGNVELPPILGSQADQAHLKAIAILYLAAALESIQLISSVETFAGVAVSGGIRADMGAAAPLLIKFWRSRHQRFTQPERQALFSRLFGTPDGPTFANQSGRNFNFATQFIQLAKALQDLTSHRSSTSPAHLNVPIRIAAQQLAHTLISRSGSIGPFAAQSLIQTIQQALLILKQPDLQRSLSSRSVWTALHQMQRLLVSESPSREQVDVRLHLGRGHHGMKILTWLAEGSPDLDGRFIRALSADHPVVVSAITWLRMSQPSNQLPDMPNQRELIAMGER